MNYRLLFTQFLFPFVNHILKLKFIKIRQNRFIDSHECTSLILLGNSKNLNEGKFLIKK